MLWLQDVFKKTAKHLNSPRHHTLSFSHHAPFDFFRLLNRPKWKEFEEMTLCHYGKLAFANSSFGASLKISIRAARKCLDKHLMPNLQLPHWNYRITKSSWYSSQAPQGCAQVAG